MNSGFGTGTPIQRRRFALHFVEALSLPEFVDLTTDQLDILGPKIVDKVSRVAGNLRDKFRDDLPYLTGTALRESWYACAVRSWEVALMVDAGEFADNEYTEKLSTAEGYAQMQGWANTLMEGLLRAEYGPEATTFFTSFSFFSNPPTANDILECMGIYWFGKAAEAQRSGCTMEAFDWIAEASDAMEFAHGLMMWDECERAERENPDRADLAASAARSALARKGALARHAENHALKADVFAWCDANMAQQKSIDAAATLVAGVVVPATWRTVRGWISDWKKMQSASTP